MRRCDTARVAIEHRMVHFRTNDITEVTSEIQEIAERANGREWITISPWVDPEHLPEISLLRRIFSGRGSKGPEVTWVPAVGNEPAQFWLLHARGANAHGILADSDAVIPPTWIKVSDHSKRGLLFGVHPDTTPEQVVDFAVAASEVLADVPTDDRWIAQVSTVAR